MQVQKNIQNLSVTNTYFQETEQVLVLETTEYIVLLETLLSPLYFFVKKERDKIYACRKFVQNLIQSRYVHKL